MLALRFSLAKLYFGFSGSPAPWKIHQAAPLSISIPFARKRGVSNAPAASCYLKTYPTKESPMNPVFQPYTFNNGATVPNRLAVAP